MTLRDVLQMGSGVDWVEDYAPDSRAEWWRDAEGHTLTYCCFDSTSRDFARFGQLYLQEGRWGDEQVVPEAWIIESAG